jgi:hypothetical protein
VRSVAKLSAECKSTKPILLASITPHLEKKLKMSGRRFRADFAIEAASQSVAGALITQHINRIQWFYYFGTMFSKSIGLEDPFLMTLIVFVSRPSFSSGIAFSCYF